jgi:hypothetical protein
MCKRNDWLCFLYKVRDLLILVWEKRHVRLRKRRREKARFNEMVLKGAVGCCIVLDAGGGGRENGGIVWLLKTVVGAYEKGEVV